MKRSLVKQGNKEKDDFKFGIFKALYQIKLF